MPTKKKPEITSAAVWLRVDELTPWKHNPRKNDHAVERVAKNIEALGFGTPIVARVMPDGSHEVIAGHTRLKAMKWLLANRGEGFTAQGTPGPGIVPVRVLEHLTDDQAAALALADNKLSEMSAWDDGMLADLMRELDEQQRVNTGFESFEIEKLFGTPVENPLDEWQGMPEFEAEKLSKRKIIVHFKSDDDARAFAELLGQKITEKTKFLWYPEVPRESLADKAFFVEKSEKKSA